MTLQFWYLALLKAKSHVLMKPTNDTKSSQNMRSTTTSMLICEIVKNWTLCYGDSLPLGDSWGGGNDIIGGLSPLLLSPPMPPP